jgi:hypothetical protein
MNQPRVSDAIALHARADEIERRIGPEGWTAARVFTQMRQLLPPKAALAAPATGKPEAAELALIERASAALSYSRNFATAKPDIGRTEREHIEGLCSLVETLARALDGTAALAAQAPPPADDGLPTLAERGIRNDRDARRYLMDLDHAVHALTGDEGEDDSVTVLQRLARQLGGKTIGAVLEALEAPPPVVGDAEPNENAIGFRNGYLSALDEVALAAKRLRDEVDENFPHPAPAGLSGEEVEALARAEHAFAAYMSGDGKDVQRVCAALRRLAAAQGRDS